MSGVSWALEEALWDKGYGVLCGVDEVGRGPLAGPVMAGAVILPPHCDIPGLDDSKKCSPNKRARLYDQILNCAAAVGIGQASPEEIDAINIAQASLLAMRRAVDNLAQTPDCLLIDGNRADGFHQPAYPYVGGDGRSMSIAAASIVAKVTRDRLMEELDALYPGYELARHKGYPTKLHKARVQELGPSPIHRRTFGKETASIPRTVGQKGEDLAADFLSERGYTIVQRNYQCPYGEIDLIARKGDTLRMIEVKTRKDSRFSRAAEAVDLFKQQKLRRAAALWLTEHPDRADDPVVFDVLEVYGDGPWISYIPNAFAE